MSRLADMQGTGRVTCYVVVDRNDRIMQDEAGRNHAYRTQRAADKALAESELLNQIGCRVAALTAGEGA